MAVKSSATESEKGGPLALSIAYVIEEGFPLRGARSGNREIAARRILLTALSGDGHACAVVLAAAEN